MEESTTAVVVRATCPTGKGAISSTEALLPIPNASRTRCFSMSLREVIVLPYRVKNKGMAMVRDCRHRVAPLGVDMPGNTLDDTVNVATPQY